MVSGDITRKLPLFLSSQRRPDAFLHLIDSSDSVLWLCLESVGWRARGSSCGEDDNSRHRLLSEARAGTRESQNVDHRLLPRN